MSNKFRVARLNVDLNQELAAKKLGIHVTTLNKYENDHREPSADVVRKMAGLYAVSVDELLGLPPTKPRHEEERMYQLKYEEKCEEVIALQKIIIDHGITREKSLKKAPPVRKKSNGE